MLSSLLSSKSPSLRQLAHLNTYHDITWCHMVLNIPFDRLVWVSPLAINPILAQPRTTHLTKMCPCWKNTVLTKQSNFPVSKCESSLAATAGVRFLPPDSLEHTSCKCGSKPGCFQPKWCVKRGKRNRNDVFSSSYRQYRTLCNRLRHEPVRVITRVRVMSRGLQKAM